MSIEMDYPTNCKSNKKRVLLNEMTEISTPIIESESKSSVRDVTHMNFKV